MHTDQSYGSNSGQAKKETLNNDTRQFYFSSEETHSQMTDDHVRKMWVEKTTAAIKTD